MPASCRSPQPCELRDAQAFVERRPADLLDGDETGFAVADAETDELLGAIARHGPFGHRAAFGYWLTPAARGRGVATRALRLIVDWTLATTEVIRLELYTDVANDASGRVAERAGFEPEGIRRAWDLDREGRPMDATFYVRLRNASVRGGAWPTSALTPLDVRLPRLADSTMPGSFRHVPTGVVRGDR